MPTLSELLISNPRGWGESPLNYDPTRGEIRNPDDPYYGTGGPSMPAKLAYMLSGIPMAREGIESAREGSLAGDPIKAAGGVGQTALAALPVMGKAATPLFETAPRLAAMLTAGTVAPMAAEGVFSASPAKAAPADPIQQLYQDRANLSQQIEEAGRIRSREERTGKGPKFQAADQDYRSLLSRKDALDARIQNLEHANSPEAEAERKQAAYEQDQANQKAELDKPFAERHPYINEAMTLGGPTLAAMLSFAGMRGIANKGNKLLQELQDARSAGNVLSMQEAAAKLDQWNKPANRLGKQAAAIALPATLPVDMRLMGDNIDKYTLPPDSKAQNAARDRLADIPQYLKDSEQALVSGLVMSATGGKTGAMTAGGAPAGDARAMLSLYGKKDPATLSQLLREGAEAGTSAQPALGAQDAAIQARRAGLSTDPTEPSLSEALAAGSGSSRGARTRSGPQPPSIPAGAGPSGPATTEAGAGRSGKLPEASQRGEGGSSSERASSHHSILQPRKKGRFSGPPKRPNNDD